jgi:hypothetical protein
MDETIQDIQPHAPRVVYHSDGMGNRMGNELCKYVVPSGFGEGCGYNSRTSPTFVGVHVSLQDVQ